MIGHTFASSGAVTLAMAPGERVGDYLVLARVDGQYAVAALATARIVEANGMPDHWIQGEYFADLESAAATLAERSGIPTGRLLDEARLVEQFIDERKS